MESIKTRGLVAKRADYGEANCILTIFTEDFGTISACCYGVKSKKSRLAAASQILCCGNFILSRKNSDLYRVESVEIIDMFYPISEDIIKLSLANYLIEITRDSFSENDPKMLNLLLNTLYVLAYKDIPTMVAKAVFELKLMQYSGYAPEIYSCIHCGNIAAPAAFDFSGGIACESCKTPAMMNIDIDTYKALKYILEASDKQIFSFTISEKTACAFSELAECYLLSKSEKKYKSLDYLKKMI